MFARPRPVAALTLAATLLAGSSVRLVASDRTSEPSAGFTITTPTLLPVTMTALAPSIFDDAVQRPPIDFKPAGPRVETGSDLTALRRSMYVSFAALQVMDAVSTQKALNNGAREANPAMAGIAKNSGAMFAVKAGTTAATTLLVEKLAKKHPKRAAMLMVALNAGYAAVVAHNYRVANR